MLDKHLKVFGLVDNFSLQELEYLSEITCD